LAITSTMALPMVRTSISACTIQISRIEQRP
jgi:hypothetical protein